jgi:general secretion pathway protein G
MLRNFHAPLSNHTSGRGQSSFVLADLIAAPAMITNWHGPYVKSIPPDPWNRPYVYVIPGVHNKTGFDLSSDGPDGRPGTSDDITNWP